MSRRAVKPESRDGYWTISIDQRQSGLPCRAGRCKVIFSASGSSLDALLEAGAARITHERIAHSYTHVATAHGKPYAWTRFILRAKKGPITGLPPAPKPRPRHGR